MDYIPSNTIRMPNDRLDLIAVEEASEGPRPRIAPLPLSVVLANVDAIHATARCNGAHFCGLPRHLQEYDLVNWLKAARAARKEAR